MLRTRKKSDKRSGTLTLPSRVFQKLSGLILSACPFFPSRNPYNLTVSHECKFVWFRVAKVGTRTIFSLLEDAGIELDAEHPSDCYYAPGFYRDYFRFAFVRNPWDRLVSCWHDKVVENNYFDFSPEQHAELQEFDHFVDYVAQLDLRTCDCHLRLQSHLIDLNHVDFVGRFERFETDLREVLKKLDLGEVEIEQQNQSRNRKDYRAYYDDRLKKQVGTMYQKDVNLFSYCF